MMMLLPVKEQYLIGTGWCGRMANRESEGYILLNRNILNWRWAKNPKTAYLFIMMIIHANYKDMDFHGRKIHRGQFVTSLESLAKSTGLTVQECRTAIFHLKSTGEITSEATNKYRIITIVNYNDYQDSTSRSTNRSTSKQQAINKQSTTREKKVNQGIKEKNNKSLRSDCPSDTPERGTDEFRNKSHLLLKPDEGTVDDIPVRYRELCNNDFAVYWGYRNQ